MNETHSDNKKLAARLDIMPMAVSLALILALCLAFFLAPEQSNTFWTLSASLSGRNSASTIWP